GSKTSPSLLPTRYSLLAIRHSLLAISLLHVLAQELQRAWPCHFGGGLVVACALVTMESMRCIRIGVDLARRALALDNRDVAHGIALVLFAEMHRHRHLGLLVGDLGDLAAVIGNRSGQAVEPRRRQECDAAAHAEADDGDRAFLLELIDRGLRVLEHRVPV